MRRLFGGSRKQQSKPLPAPAGGVGDPPPDTPKTPQAVQTTTTTGTKPGQNLTVDTRPASLVLLRLSSHKGTSQSTSSDASSSVRTPSDYEPLEDTQNKKSWASWMVSGKRRKQSPGRNRRPAVSDIFPKPNARPPPAPSALDGDTTSDEDDTSNASWSDLAGGDGLFPSARPAFVQQRPRPRPPQELSNAIANLRAITLNGLQSVSHTTSPLVQSQSSPQFPRSSNLVNRFLPLPLMCVEVHKKRLLKRLESRKLDRLEQTSILPFSTRARTRNKAIRTLSSSEETMAVSKAVRGGWSCGMKKWALRPCFEERVVVWSVDDTSHLVRAPVLRSSLLGVAELEFSEGAEALAGLHRQNELPPPPSGEYIPYFTLYFLTADCLDIYVPAASCRLPPPLVIPRKSPLLHSSSGTRFDLQSNKLVGVARASMPDLTLPEEGSGDEDDLPLGVVLYRRRESHAQRRSQFEEAQRLHKLSEEAKQRGAKAKAKQEEVQKKKFAEQIAAARERREQVRTGKPAKDPWFEGVDSGAVPPVKTRKPVEASSTLTKDSASRCQTLPANSLPQWPEIPPSMGVPLTASLTVPYPCGQMPFVDPLQIAMFEQGMRVWAYNESANGSLTGPRFLGSSGSTGSLTPPRSQNLRPPSFAPSTEERNARLSRPRSHISSLEDVGLRRGREPSTSGQTHSRTRLDGEGPHSSNILHRSSSALPDLNSGSRTVARAGHNYPPSSSSRLAQPPATLPSDPSTGIAHHPLRPHTNSMPNRSTRTAQRRMTVGATTKGESDRPSPSLASTSTPKEGKRTLTSYGSIWSIRDKLQSRTMVS